MIDSIKKTILERMTSPFAGTFALAWSAFNWKIIIILFGDFTTAKKITDIQALLSDVKIVLWYPLGYSLAALAAYSFLSVVAYGLFEWSVPAKKWISSLFGSASLITRDEKLALLEEMDLREKAAADRINQKDIEIKIIKSQHEEIKGLYQETNTTLDIKERALSASKALVDELQKDKAELLKQRTAKEEEQERKKESFQVLSTITVDLARALESAVNPGLEEAANDLAKAAASLTSPGLEEAAKKFEAFTMNPNPKQFGRVGATKPEESLLEISQDKKRQEKLEDMEIPFDSKS